MKAEGLRIALVGPLPPPSGGIANQTLQLANLLRLEGATVEVIQMNPPYRPCWIKRIRGVRAIFRLVPYLVHLWRTARTVQLYHVMANSGWSWHLFAAPAIWIASIRGKPVIVHYHGGEAERFLSKAVFWVKASLRRTDALIVPSGFLEAVFSQHGFATDVVPNIVNLSRFSSDDNTRPAPHNGSPCILVARNLEPIYDNATALRAVSIVRENYPSVTLIIAGSGTERRALEEIAIELGLTDAVTFTGRVDNEDMAALFRKADVMINPSLVDNMPVSLLEALASGVPVVTTRVGGIPYLVEHEKTALLVPPQDAHAMASAILALLDNPAKAIQIKGAGIEAVQKYSWPKVRSRLMEVYGKVLAERNNAMAGAK